MAPKGSKKPTKKSLAIEPFEPELSSDYDSEIFTSSQAYIDFRKSWVSKAAAVERNIELWNFQGGFGLEEEFERRGWNTLANYRGDYILTLCAELMANIIVADKTPGQERLVTWVRGKDIVITPATFCRHYGLRREPNPEFCHGVGNPSLTDMAREILDENQPWIEGKTQCEKKLLKLRYLPLFLFSCHSLLPQARYAQVSLPRAQLMWAIGTQKTIDLPRYMFLQLYEDATNMTRGDSIPFVCMLTAVILESGIVPPTFLSRKSSIGPVNMTSIHKSEAQYRSHKKKRTAEEAEEGDMGVAAEGSSQAGQPSLDRVIEMLELQALQQQHQTQLLEAHTNTFAAFQTEVYGRFDKIDKEQKLHGQAIEELQREIARSVWDPSTDM